MAEKWATEKGTEAYFEKISVHPGKIRRFDSLFVSALGAGTYLGACDDETDALYEQALLQAALGGVNFFDTAINYRGMRSEKALAKTIRAMAAKGILREQIVVCTKGGYIPFEGKAEEFEDYLRIHYLDPKLVDQSEIVAETHCMSPSFLENQIAASLKNLGLDCIDLYLLHNPEVELEVLGDEEFYQRLSKAFSLFEKQVREKKIRRYGLATWNGFRMKKGSLQLEKIAECARQAGGEKHHFKAIMLPFNLVMLEAIKMKNQNLKTIWEAAKAFEIAILGSSPFMQGQVANLCSRVFEKLPPEESPMLQALQFVLSAPWLASGVAGMKESLHWEENRKALTKAPWPKKDWDAAVASLGIKPE
jgi:aryl-alcohol dehydrogenase-like predicted oxidoreductase